MEEDLYSEERDYWDELIDEWNLDMALKWTGLEWDLHLIHSENESN